MSTSFKNRLPFISTVIIEGIASLIVFLFLRNLFIPFAVLVLTSILILRENAWILTASVLVGVGFAYLEGGTRSQQLVIVLLIVGGSLLELLVRFLQSRLLKSVAVSSPLLINILFAVIGIALSAGWIYNHCSGYSISNASSVSLALIDENSPIYNRLGFGGANYQVAKYYLCLSDFVVGDAELADLEHVVEQEDYLFLGKFLMGSLGRWLFISPIIYAAIFAGLGQVLFSRFSFYRWIIQSFKAALSVFFLGVWINVIIELLFTWLIKTSDALGPSLFSSMEQGREFAAILMIVEVTLLRVVMAIFAGLGARWGMKQLT